MFDSVKNKFLFCLPLLGGCFFIGAMGSIFGSFCLVFTLYNLPLNRLAICEFGYYINYFIFLTILIIYYVGLIFAGYETMCGVAKRKHTKMIPMLAALIAFPTLVYPLSYVYTDELGVYSYYNNYNYQYIGPNNPFLLYNGSLIFVFATFGAGYFAFCIINGIRLIENGQKNGKLSNFDMSRLNFKTFLGFLSLETGALAIATTSVILGVAFMLSLSNTRPYNSDLSAIFYYISSTIVFLFYAALVIGGILVAKGIEKKKAKMIKPLMTTLFVQPALTIFFYSTYCSRNSYFIDYGIATFYAFLTILDLYFGFCIRSLLRTEDYDPDIFSQISYERVNTLDEITFDASNPNGIVN